MDDDLFDRLSRDERGAAKLLGRAEARYLVDTYYQMQHNRITSANQVRATEATGEPNAVLRGFADKYKILEGQIKTSLELYVRNDPVGTWAIGQIGIGPVIAAGFLSRLDLRPTVGSWWRFCGLDPTVTWGKGEKRPWNAELKRLCYLTGESFTKQSSHPKCYYGHQYLMRKAWEVERNDAGHYAPQAAAALTNKNYVRETTARASYEQGKLPPAHIHRRAQRWAVKLFLAHLHEIWWQSENEGAKPALPYPIAILGHAHYLPPPGV